MADRIEFPAQPAGKAEEQLQQMYSYLYRLATTLNINLANAGSEAVALTDQEQQLMNKLNTQTESGVITAFQEAETLKSLIIKTATFVKTQIDEYKMVLFGETEMDSQFGNLRQKKGLRVDITPDGIKQSFSFAEIIKGLKTYEINSKNYIKTGYLRTENALPIYGVQVGRDIVTFAEDGQEIYNDGNKVAEFTADELTFYQHGTKMASYNGNEVAFYINGYKAVSLTGTALTFYIGQNTAAKYEGNRIGFYNQGTEYFYIAGGKIYSAGDMEIASGKKIKLAASGAAAEIGGNLIKLESGQSIILIDPEQINMNTTGLVKLKGNSQSEIKFYDQKGLTFSADPVDGIYGQRVETGDLKTASGEATNMQIGTLNVRKLIADNIVYSLSRPADGNNTIWLEPVTESGSGDERTETRSVNAAAAHACSMVTGGFSYPVGLSANIDLTDVTGISFSGAFNRNGADQTYRCTITAVINCSDGTSISLGEVGSGQGFSKYTLSGSITEDQNTDIPAKIATGMTYTVSFQSGMYDGLAHYSSFDAGTLTFTIEDSGDVPTDVCTVHFIP